MGNLGIYVRCGDMPFQFRDAEEHGEGAMGKLEVAGRQAALQRDATKESGFATPRIARDHQVFADERFLQHDAAGSGADLRRRRFRTPLRLARRRFRGGSGGSGQRSVEVE